MEKKNIPLEPTRLSEPSFRSAGRMLGCFNPVREVTSEMDSRSSLLLP